MGTLLGGVGCALPGAQPAAQEEGEGDPLSLAALLIRDRFYERARAVLAEVDPKREGLDLARYHTLRGLVELAGGRHAEARDAFAQAFARGQREPVVWLYQAQAHYGLGAWAEALAALERAGAAAASAEALRMRAHCQWQTGARGAAFATLAAGEARYPADAVLPRQRTLYLLELGLYLEAALAGEEFLRRAGRSVEAYLALGEALRRARQPDAAARALEAARLVHPGARRLLVALARAHLDAGRPRAAASLLEEVARDEPRFLAEAAELYRRAGDLRRALYLNAQVQDQKAKARQRLGLLVQRGAAAQACALAPRLARLTVLEDEDARYALAYACFRAGDLDQAVTHLRGITRADLFQAATDLRQAIEAQRVVPVSGAERPDGDHSTQAECRAQLDLRAREREAVR
ncbi:MAG: hypothetical protein AB7N76_15735 [Planctomycetota bacterium]